MNVNPNIQNTVEQLHVITSYAFEVRSSHSAAQNHTSFGCRGLKIEDSQHNIVGTV